MQFQASLEYELSTLLQKPLKLEETLSTVKTSHADRLVAVCDFLLFMVQCELFSEPKTAFIILVLLRTAQEASFMAYVGELLNFVQASKSPMYKLAAFTYLSDPKLVQVLGLDSDGLKTALDKTATAKKSAEIDKKIAAEIASTPPLGPQPKKHAFFFDNQAPQYFDFPDLFQDTAKSYNALVEGAPECSDPDLLLPLPSVVEPCLEDLVTPFPFFLEAPLFNPDFPQVHSAALILKNMKKATDYDIDAS